MRVKFDALNRFEMPSFYLCNPGSIYNGTTLTNILGYIPDTSDEELVLNFNTTSELNFRVNRVKRLDADDDAYVKRIFDSIKNRRLIFVDGIGFFVVTSVIDEHDNGEHYKDVRAESCEYEIGNRGLPYIADGTYKFIDLLKLIVASIPIWTIGDVNLDISDKYRTFEDVSVDKIPLAFLLEDMQDAYECIFVFDIINRRINVYDQNNYVNRTFIHLTKDDLVNSIEITENSDDLYTALSVQGDENLNISPVNPIGTNVIYNFDYYLSWMTDSLSAKVEAWQSLVASKKQGYYDLNLAYYNKLSTKSDTQSEIDMLHTQKDMYQRCRDNIIAEGSTVTVASYNDIIEKNGGVPVGVQNEIAETVAEIDSLLSNVNNELDTAVQAIANINSELDNLTSQIEAIHESVSILKYFTDDEYAELSNYIFEGNYSDEYIAVTDSMTYTERFQQMKTLYDRAVAQLIKISSPTQEFSMDIENYIFAKEFEEWSEQLETGCLINVELETNDIAELFLTNITVNYEDCSLAMTFGNRFNRFDPKALFGNVLGDVKKSANSISYIKDILYPVKNGEFSEMRAAIESSGILTKNAALASENQEILIDDTGILGRKLLDNGEYDPKQIKITNQTIVFTDDGWDTSRTGLGNFYYNNPLTGEVEEHYGIIADTLIGSLVLSEEVGIYNTDNSITLDKNGFTMTSDYTSDSGSKNVFTIQKLLLDDSGNPYYEKQLYIDDDGNVVLNGSISIFTGNGSTSLEDVATGSVGKTQYLHIKYSDDGRSFTGNLVSSNIADWESGAYMLGSLSPNYDHYISYPVLIPVTPGEEIRISCGNENFFCCYLGYSDETTSVSGHQMGTGEYTYTIKDTYQYIRIYFVAVDASATFETFQEAFNAGEFVPTVYRLREPLGEEMGAYVGTLVDFTEEASTTFSDYTWKRFTEDVEEELEALQKSINDSTASLYKAISDESTAIYEEINGKYNSLSTKVTEQITNSVNTESTSIRAKMTENYNALIEKINGEISSHKADVGQYMTYDEAGLTLGASSSDFKTVIDNKGLYFKQKDTIVSYVNNNQLYIPNAVIESTLILGNFFFSPKDDGGFSLIWQDNE